MPLFFTNENFRHHLVSNVKYNLDVRDFWLTRFANKREYDQQRQVDAALTRISILLGHPYIKHIIGQTKSKLDFSKIIEDKEAIFLKLSAALSQDIKKFIGMIVIGELLHHIRRRKIYENDRMFCVFIDEFQNFATSDDLATLITEARKYNIATTLAHQERHGQLGDNKKMQGATLAAFNKVYFRLTIKDAEELAGEFARDPPPETRLEEQYAISQNPVSDLLKTHNNPEVMEFVNEYLRPIKNRLNDIIGESELNRLMQQEYTQDANYFRVAAKRWPSDDRTYAAIKAKRNAMRYEEKAILSAREQTDKLQALNVEATNLQQMLRKINTLFVQIMEGKINHGSDSFIQAIISIMKHIDISNGERNIYEFYFSVALLPELCSTLAIFGDPRSIAVPYIIAKQEGKYLNEVAELEREVEENHKKQMVKWEALSYEAKSRLNWHSPERKPYADLAPRYICYSDRITFTRRVRSLITNDNIVNPLWKLIEVCRLLAEPENHIKVKTGQYVEKQVYTRSEADMKAEVVKELANLPKYTAWIKTMDGANPIKKRKVRIYNVNEYYEDEKYNKDRSEILREILKETHDRYCTRRDLIEEEIIKRQAKWREGMQNLPAEQAPGQEVTGDSDKPDKPKPPSTRSPTKKVSEEKGRDRLGKPPPPSSIPAQTAAETQNSLMPQTENNPEEKGLIYRSNFYLPDDRWTENETTDIRKFRRDGYYHIQLNNPIMAMEFVNIPISDFKVCVDAQLVKEGETIVYGVYFRCVEDSNGLSCYLFAFISRSYCLFLFRNREYELLLDYRSSEFISSDSINSLMVEMVGQRITLGINGHILDTITDNSLTLPGYVGIFEVMLAYL